MFILNDIFFRVKVPFKPHSINQSINHSEQCQSDAVYHHKLSSLCSLVRKCSTRVDAELDSNVG